MFDQGELHRHIEVLNRGDKSSRQETLRSLKSHPEQEWTTAPHDIIGPLVEALRFPLTEKGAEEGLNFPSAFRQEVATVLGNIGPRSEPAVPQLAGLLKKGHGEVVREAAAIALGKIGKKAKPAVDDLVSVLQSDCKDSLAGRVARALGGIGCTHDAVCTALEKLWLSSAGSSKSQAAVALCQLGCDAPGLMTALTGNLVSRRDAAFRKAAAEALGWCSKKQAGVVPALAAALTDEDEDIRQLAASGLQRMGVSQAEALQSCCKQLKDAPCAEAALARFGTVAVPVLIQALAAEDPAAREKAARILGGMGEVAAEAAPALCAALRDVDRDVRLAAAKAVWNITKEAEEAVPALAKLLGWMRPQGEGNGDSRRSFLQGVIEALARIGAPAKAAVPMLLKKARDENRHVRESALRALRQIDPEAASQTDLS
jgi:HEAT repeat protein